jgi:hypothetical protein
MQTSPKPEQPVPDRAERSRAAVERPAETDQDVDTAGTEADESAVGSALDRSTVARDPHPDKPGARP